MNDMFEKKLGVNIDHIATLRQARNTAYPCPVEGAIQAQKAGADIITFHLREDRRHIQDDDLPKFKEKISALLNMELAATDEMIEIATKFKPDYVCIVPEKREELTTEGGLDVLKYKNQLKDYIQELKHSNIEISLFIDPAIEQIQCAYEVGAEAIEIHTGEYAVDKKNAHIHLDKILQTTQFANQLGLKVNAGHGLDYTNTQAIAQIEWIQELNIGHSIVSYAVFVGMYQAVKQMLEIIKNTNKNYE